MVQLPSLIKQADFFCSTKESFEQSLREILPKIHRGEIEKAVPVSFTRSAKVPTNVDKLKWMQGALSSPSNLWAYGFWKEDVQGIIGATPEILFDLKEGRLETMALAGTMPKSEVHQRGSLLNDAKERWEHDLVVRDLKTQLGKLGGVICGNTEVIELPTLFHLRTLLQVNLSSGIFSKGEVRKNMVEQIIQLLHPTPALGVAPRSYGYQWLRDLPDQAERKHHGAPVCISLPHRTICLVAIRNIQWNNKGTQIGAGCGIVKESQLDREWSEITQKINSVFQILGIE
jgi:menaquinone-specific isochorismate synthase